jgi:hypothetical protein
MVLRVLGGTLFFREPLDLSVSRWLLSAGPTNGEVIAFCHDTRKGPLVVQDQGSAPLGSGGVASLSIDRKVAYVRLAAASAHKIAKRGYVLTCLLQRSDRWLEIARFVA